MLVFTLNYGKKDKNGVLRLSCQKLGEFPVLTGKMPYTDLPECAFKPLASLPVGRYWIVDRPDGSWGNRIRGAAIDVWKAQTKGENTPAHSEWFGLFSNETMTDTMFINGTERGSFRLHPLNGDGSGISEGCITFYRVNDFNTVKSALLKEGKAEVSNDAGKKLDAYGYIDVINVPSFQSHYLSSSTNNFICPLKKASPLERPEYYLLSREEGCVGAIKNDVLKYGKDKTEFRKQIEQDANEELKRIIREKMSHQQPLMYPYN